MAENLPVGTIRFGCKIVKLESHPIITSHTILHLQDGTVIKAKVVIGCHGVHSVVGDWLEWKPTRRFNLCGVVGFTTYPNGHGFGNEFVRIRGDHMMAGRLPIDEKLVYWFVARPRTPQGISLTKSLCYYLWFVHAGKKLTILYSGFERTKVLRDSTMELIKDFPAEIPDLIKNCDLDSVSLFSLRRRENFRKGTVTVAGDAMHVMGPFVGQGGTAALEDAVVLGRCFAQEMVAVLDSERSNKNNLD
ncbi:monooxygenase 1-like [Macadamia integrifolia]|uniref:monooxygenase 1-like n=1 Tax=Macadamia integrifolia TaxID=60698 RepID=UPI001C52C1E9|nr:monooxygenase 1-like [Macadamia integrifolia]